MKTVLSKFACLLAAVLSLSIAAPVSAQGPSGRVSPPDVSSVVVEANRVSVYYARPYTKDPKSGEPRKIWGGLVPYGKVWRTGANEATLLVTQKAIKIADTTVPAGAYSLYTLPAEDGSATLIINKAVGQWGSQYDESQDLARVALKGEDLAESVDQFTMKVAKSQDETFGTISMMWEKKKYSVDYTVVK